MPIKAGIQAPDFTLQDENGTPRSLSSYHGSPVVLYFYPKDDTPGCTTEACAFRDDMEDYRRGGVTVLGVSPGSPADHKRFKEKYHLNFNLLADVGHHVCEQYGVWGLKKNFGKEYTGVFRTTYLIDAEGKITQVFENVQPQGHSAEILQALGVIPTQA